MNPNVTEPALQLRSLVKSSGELELSLVSVPTPEPAPDEVLIRVDAAPINPSDLGLLFGAADMSTARQSGTDERPVVTASIPQGLMKAMAARVDQSMPVGNEGAGVVAELRTTFASHYTKVVSLAEALQLQEIAVCGRRTTGEKYLINPNK